MKQNKETTAVRCPICYEKVKCKAKSGFWFWFSITRFLVNLIALVDKYFPKIWDWFDNDM